MYKIHKVYLSLLRVSNNILTFAASNDTKRRALSKDKTSEKYRYHGIDSITDKKPSEDNSPLVEDGFSFCVQTERNGEGA